MYNFGQYATCTQHANRRISFISPNNIITRQFRQSTLQNKSNRGQLDGSQPFYAESGEIRTHTIRYRDRRLLGRQPLLTSLSNGQFHLSSVTDEESPRNSRLRRCDRKARSDVLERFLQQFVKIDGWKCEGFVPVWSAYDGFRKMSGKRHENEVIISTEW